MQKPKPLDSNWTIEDLRRWIEEFIRWKQIANKEVMEESYGD